MTADDGILEQLTLSLRGFGSHTDSLLEVLSKAQVPDPIVQKEMLAKLRALGLLPNDGARARDGNRLAQNRIHEALMIIAEAKIGRRPNSISKEVDGATVFGLKAIPKLKKAPEISQAAREEMMRANGILEQLTRNLRRFGSKTDSVMEAFAKSQVTDPLKQAALIRKLKALGIGPSDGNTAKTGTKLAQDRIHEALMLIIEAKSGHRPEQISRSEDGARWFGFQ
jgi:hypothetical protein